MKFKNLNPLKWFGAKSAQDIYNVPLNQPLTEFLQFVLGGGYSSDYRVTTLKAYQYYEKIAPLRNAVDMLAKAIAGLPLGVMAGDDEKLQLDHEALEKIRKPGAQNDRSSLLTELTASLLLTDEAWVTLSGGIARPPVEIGYVRPYDVDVISGIPVGGDGYPERIRTSSPKDSRIYYKHEIDGEFRYIDSQSDPAGASKELVPIIGMVELADQFRGMSQLSAIKKELDQVWHGNVHNSSMLEKGMRPSAIFSPKAEATPKAIRELVESVRKQFSGSEAAGGIFVSPAQLESVEMTINNKDADYVKLIQQAQVRIYSLFEIPLPLIMPEQMTLSNFEASQISFYDRPVTSVFQQLFSGISRILGIRYGIDGLKIMFNQHGVKALQQRQAERMETLRKSYALSTDQILATAGYSPTEAGEKVMIPATLVPLSGGEAGFDD